MSDSDKNVPANSTALDAPAPAPSQPRLVDVEVTSEIVALNLMVSFLNLAQRRGIFSIDESAKIWECIKKFQKASGSGSE
jgi:hypothetical protein